MSSPTDPNTYIEEIVARYVDDGDVDKALEVARQQVFDLIKDTGTGLPTIVVLEAMELWMLWVLRALTGVVSILVVEAMDDWDDGRGEIFLNEQLTLYMLLKEDAMRSVIQMRMPDADTKRETEG